MTFSQFQQLYDRIAPYHMKYRGNRRERRAAKIRNYTAAMWHQFQTLERGGFLLGFAQILDM